MFANCVGVTALYCGKVSHEDRGGTVVKVLCYKSEGRWFDLFQDYIDFLRRSKHKFYRKRNRITQVGNYLSILEIDQG